MYKYINVHQSSNGPNFIHSMLTNCPSPPKKKAYTTSTNNKTYTSISQQKYVNKNLKKPKHLECLQILKNISEQQSQTILLPINYNILINTNILKENGNEGIITYEN